MGINVVDIHCYVGIIVVCIHFYVGINVVGIHFYMGIIVVDYIFADEYPIPPTRELRLTRGSRIPRL